MRKSDERGLAWFILLGLQLSAPLGTERTVSYHEDHEDFREDLDVEGQSKVVAVVGCYPLSKFPYWSVGGGCRYLGQILLAADWGRPGVYN